MNRLVQICFVLLALVSLNCSFKTDKSKDQNITVEPTYKSLQAKVFTPKCVHCHSGGSAPHGIVCASWENMMNSAMFPPLIVPGNPEASSLYTAIKNGSMPKNEAALSLNEINAVYTWIKNGAKKTEDQPAPTPTPRPTEPGCDLGEPGCDDNQGGGDFSKNEPCDLAVLPSEPGFKKCSN